MNRSYQVPLLRILTLLVIMLLALPVLLLPISTVVPAPVWVLLGAADVGLAIALFRSKWTGRAIGLTIAGALGVVLLAVAASQMFAAAPAIVVGPLIVGSSRRFGVGK
ncbi:MAG: hypothetical protein M1482_01225 [Chloroflexi bacterium]|nr:hypothetical protein [Chloroflexota bacterium]